MYAVRKENPIGPAPVEGVKQSHCFELTCACSIDRTYTAPRKTDFGTMNCLHVADHFSEERQAIARDLGTFAALAFFVVRDLNRATS
jgi:hypothetical protein